MEELQTWPDEPALDALRESVTTLVSLDSPDACDVDETVGPAVSAICRSIEMCEQAGVDKREILAYLGGARALHAQSPFIARAQAWPRGYPGDFETIEYLCEAANHAPAGSVGHALEELALRSPITAQHRNKLKFQSDAMLRACERNGGRARILSIGCGGCRDIRLAAEALRQTDAEFVLCDLDYEALDFALHAVGPLAERCTYLNATVPRVLRKLVTYGPFDLAIVGGVFDYLPDRWVTLTVRHLWHSLLSHDGELIFTNIKRGNPHRVWLEYLANWELKERDEADLIRCCTLADVPSSAVRVEIDRTGLALLASCQRRDE